MPDNNRIVRCAICPGLGVARVGNAPGPDDSYYGPEAPGIVTRPEGGYKDNEDRVKRQAARFRVYGVNTDGRAVREITADVGQVEWRVHLANRKAGWYQFLNAMDLGPNALPARRHNEAIRGAERARLIIDPGSRRISGPHAGGGAEHAFDTGGFFGTLVYLGELRTDEAERLIVLGGRGHSAAQDPRMQPTTFANNDLWHDEVADGPVRATVRIGADTFEADPAMVAVAPPNFCPGLTGVVTLYDLVCDVFG